MPKTDKELAVELASAYIRAWFSRQEPKKPLDGETLAALVKDAYDAVHALPTSDAGM